MQRGIVIVVVANVVGNEPKTMSIASINAAKQYTFYCKYPR